MPEQLILNDSWTEYDEYKLAKQQNPDIFFPADSFETDFLVRRIMDHYPQYTEMAVRLSITHMQRILFAGCKRNVFVKLVLGNLVQRKPLNIS